jgi:hypothetical protein
MRAVLTLDGAHAVAFAATLAIVPLGSCSLVYDGGEHTDAPPLAAADACVGVGNVFCTAWQSCCPSLPVPETCVERFAAECSSSEGLASALTSEIARYDAEGAGRWLAQAMHGAERCDASILELLAYERFVRVFFAGSISEGGDCSAAPTPVEAVLACEQPFVCTAVAGRATCAEPRAVNEECVTGLDCADGLYCDMRAPPSICRPRLPIGSSCTSGNECETFACAEGTCIAADLRALFCP